MVENINQADDLKENHTFCIKGDKIYYKNMYISVFKVDGLDLTLVPSKLDISFDKEIINFQSKQLKKFENGEEFSFSFTLNLKDENFADFLREILMFVYVKKTNND